MVELDAPQTNNRMELSLNKPLAAFLSAAALAGTAALPAGATEQASPHALDSGPQKGEHLTRVRQVLPHILRRIGGCESGHHDPNSEINYRAQNPVSSASGGFQIEDITWDHFKGYRHAKDAPKRIQIWKAKLLLHSKTGLRHWDASRSCWD